MPAKIDFNDTSVVVIIGSGAGGGTLANELAKRGISVVVLEAGKRMELTEFKNDEIGMFGAFTWFDPRTSSGSWYVAKSSPDLPAWTCKLVGGTTVHWGACALRFQEHEFKSEPQGYRATTHQRFVGTGYFDEVWRDTRCQSARLAY